MNRTPEDCEYLVSYLEGRLDGEMRERFERHLAACGDCEAQLASWHLIKGAYADWVTEREAVTAEVPSPTEASAFAAAVLERLEEQKGRPLPRKQPALLYVAAAAAVVLALLGMVRFLDRDAAFNTAHPMADRQVPSSETTLSLPFSIPIVQIVEGVASKFVLEASPGTQIVAPKNGRILAAVLNDKVGVDASGVLVLASADPADTILRLNRGVIACSVARREDGGRFKVIAGDVTVEVKGTRFSVSLREDGAVTVVVAEGSVQVTAGNENVVLEGGQVVTVAGGDFSAAAFADAEKLNVLLRLLSDEVAAFEMEGFDAGAPDSINAEGSRGTTLRDSRITKTNIPRKEDEAWRALIIHGNVAEAHEQITAYLKFSPADADARMLLAVCQKKLHLFKEAVDSYKRVSVSADVGLSNRARYLAGELCQSNLGDDEAAVRFFEAYLDNTPMDAPNRAEAKLRLAESLLKLGNEDRAEKVLTQIIAEYGRTPIANQARSLLEQNH